MDIRLGDLYDLIIRIVDDRLKQRSETERPLTARGAETHFSDPSERSPNEEKALLLNLSEQITNLINLQRQLLETVQAGQRRTETLLSELLDLIKQQVEVSRTSNGRRLTQTLTEEGKQIDGEGDREENSDSEKSYEPRLNTRSDKPHETSPTKGYTTMSLPDMSDEEMSFVPSDGWLKEASPQPSVSELLPDGVSAPTISASLPQIGNLTDQLSDYLRRLFGIEVDYLRARQTPSSPSIQDAQVLVGEGTYNGQLVTLTVFGKSHITPTDVTIFYNAVVRPLRGSVTEPVMSIVFGETFESKALKVAHALDLLVVNLKDLREISGGEV